MKITLFATIAGTGGIQMNGRGLARTLLRAGCEVQALSSILNVATAGEVKSGENEELLRMGAKIIYLPERSNPFARCCDFFRLARTMRTFQPDILIGTGTSWHLGLLGLAASSAKRRIFYEGMSGEANGIKDPRWLVRWFFNEVVGQSPRVSENFKNSFGWKKRLTPIPAFPEPLECTAALPEARRRTVPLGKARAAFFSRLVTGKQAFWLVQQWPTLKNLVSILDIHGAGPERPMIDAFISAHGLTDRVRCCGPYPSGQAYVNLLRSYDVTLLPTIFPEGAPLVLLESMACGVPFVANGMGGIPDYALGNPDCVVSPQQSEFLDGVRRMVKSLAADEIDHERLQRFYFKQYSQAAIEKRWLKYLAV